MGYVPPPRALTKDEFAKAIIEGKTTMAEIDPNFYNWYKYGQTGRNYITEIFNFIFRRNDIKKIEEKKL